MGLFDMLFGKKKNSRSTESNLFTTSNEPKVVDLRSDAAKQAESNSGNGLAADREALAREMVQFLKTHDTGNNMDHYNEFRERFHERSEAIAKSGGYNQALQEIYYRVRALCNEQGVYFHSGAVGNVFEGEFWSN